MTVLFNVFSEFSVMLAQTTAPTTAAANRPGWASFFDNPLYFVILMGVVLMFTMSRSKRGQQKKVEETLSKMKKGDRIRTIGGILGTIVELRDDEVVVKVDETSNTKMRFVRSAIHAVINDGDKSSAAK